uniref:Multidrug resistance protein 1 n=2 Tax=Schistocephalus solidus TaxID=70667 RepID=A0A0X3P980_SCHSO
MANDEDFDELSEVSKSQNITSDFKKTKKTKIGLKSLLRYADKLDKVLLCFGILFSIFTGVLLPANLLIFQKVVNAFTTSSASDVIKSMTSLVPTFVILGSACLVLAFVQMFCLDVSSRRQGRRIRLLLFQSILRQEVGWFDEQSVGNLITRLSNNVDSIEGGIGERLGHFLQNISTFLAAVIVSLVSGWKLALVGLSITPLVLTAFLILAFSLRKFSVKEILSYESAGTIATEVLTAIRTVFAFGGQEKECARYEKELQASSRIFFLKSVFVGLGTGAIGCTIFIDAAICFAYGVQLILYENYENGTVVLVILCFIVGSTSLGRALPEIEFFSSAIQSAASVFEIIQRVPEIDVSADGEELPSTDGEIAFENVSFYYPSRPDVPILKNFSLTIPAGKTVAIVGPSGSGKSTTVQLIQRLYDPLEGRVTLDGVDLRQLDVKWLRQQIGVVSQEPVLFAGTVEENIRLGDPEATDSEVEEAARMADAHGFIIQLPQAYKTVLSEGGGKMSGGQKQRVAIARALVRNPPILLLDEATSALDNKSERAIQAAIERAAQGRTVLMIAHRLSTVRGADQIVVVDKGEVREMGTHEELLAKGGVYANMLLKLKDAQGEHSENEADDVSGSEDEFVIGGEKPRLSEVLKKQGVWRASRVSDAESLASYGSMVSLLPEKQKHAVLKALRMNRPEWYYLAIGLLMMMLGGLTLPSFALLYSEMFQIFTMIGDPVAMKARTSFICGMFGLMAILRLLLGVGGNAALGIAGARLTRRARRLFFGSILNQEMAWFDKPENQAGILTARLAVEVQSLQKITGTQLGVVIESITLVVSALIIAFSYNWKLALLNLTFFPILVVGGALQMRQMNRGAGQNACKGADIAQEAFAANRTVVSLGLQPYMYEKFKKASAPTAKELYAGSGLFAAVHTLANSIIFFQFAAFFYVAAILFDTGEVGVLAVFRIFASINFAGQGLGRTASLAPDFKSAHSNIKRTIETIERTTKMDVNVGLTPETALSGAIEFKNVCFSYPARPNTRILKSFSHSIEPNTSTALVGTSGCGKSTIIQLVQRLYDVEQRGPGSGIFVDGMDLRTLSPNWIRDQIGIVSQEPNLFDVSIRENIAYGLNKEEPSMEQIIQAAKQANVHEFIEALPEGYETRVGAGGSLLSGGQKQRIAIARALIRKPRLLLLDEATSALDVDSERIVQATLDAAMQEGSRTSMVVAHRLTTVENCDSIVVLANGRKIESGPPQALMQTRGAYYALHNVDAAVVHH